MDKCPCKPCVQTCLLLSARCVFSTSKVFLHLQLILWWLSFDEWQLFYTGNLMFTRKAAWSVESVEVLLVTGLLEIRNRCSCPLLRSLLHAFSRSKLFCSLHMNQISQYLRGDHWSCWWYRLLWLGRRFRLLWLLMLDIGEHSTICASKFCIGRPVAHIQLPLWSRRIWSWHFTHHCLDVNRTNPAFPVPSPPDLVLSAAICLNYSQQNLSGGTIQRKASLGVCWAIYRFGAQKSAYPATQDDSGR